MNECKRKNESENPSFIPKVWNTIFFCMGVGIDMKDLMELPDIFDHYGLFIKLIFLDLPLPLNNKESQKTCTYLKMDNHALS